MIYAAVVSSRALKSLIWLFRNMSAAWTAKRFGCERKSASVAARSGTSVISVPFIS